MKKTYAPILVPVGTRCTLCNLFGVTYATIRKALAGVVRTPQHLEIRAKALELGGVVANDEQPTQTANNN